MAKRIWGGKGMNLGLKRNRMANSYSLSDLGDEVRPLPQSLSKYLDIRSWNEPRGRGGGLTED